MYPTAQDRKAHPYTVFRKNLRQLTLDDEGKNPLYEMEGTDEFAEMYNASHPELPDPKQLYKQTIFDKVYNDFKASVIHDNEDGTKSYDIEPMKLAEIHNKAMNRTYELNILDDVCEKMFGRKLLDIPSRVARQKFLCKKMKKTNREQVRQTDCY